jgi:hypothetical protein
MATPPEATPNLANDEPPIAVSFQEYEVMYRELFREQNPTRGDVQRGYGIYLSTRQAPRA